MRKAEGNVEKIMEEHRRMREILGKMQKVIQEKEHHWPRVASLVTELSMELKTHFAHEEEGGYFHEMLERAPRLETNVKLLEKQHPALLHKIKEIVFIVADGDGSPQAWARLTSSYGDFLHHLMEHEREENRLMQQIYNRDFGAGD